MQVVISKPFGLHIFHLFSLAFILSLHSLLTFFVAVLFQKQPLFVFSTFVLPPHTHTCMHTLAIVFPFSLSFLQKLSVVFALFLFSSHCPTVLFFCVLLFVLNRFGPFPNAALRLSVFCFRTRVSHSHFSCIFALFICFFSVLPCLVVVFYFIS